MEYQVEIVRTDSCYEGFFTLKRHRVRHSLFAGGMSQPLERERMERLRAAAVLLYDPLTDEVVMIEQFRIGALEAGGAGSWLLEIVGGLMNDGDDPAAVAEREAMEEAGCRLRALKPICDFYVSPGTATEFIHLYCGWVDARAAGGIHGLPHEGEDILVRVMSADEVMAELYGGRVNSTTAIIAVQWLALHRPALRREWLATPP